MNTILILPLLEKKHVPGRPPVLGVFYWAIPPFQISILPDI